MLNFNMNVFHLILGLLFVFSNVNAWATIIPKFTKESPNILLKTYNDIKGNVYEVEDFEDIKPFILQRYGVIKIRSTKSVIVSDSIAQNSFSSTYKPPFLNQSHSSKVTNLYYEVNYSNVTIIHEPREWIPLNPCRTNHASTTSTYTQGWTVGIQTGAFAAIRLSQLFGIRPQALLDLALGKSISGTLSCNVDSGKTFQPQIMLEKVTVSGIKARKVKITKLNNVFYQKSLKFEMEDYFQVEPWREVSKKNIQTACVTSPQYLAC